MKSASLRKTYKAFKQKLGFWKIICTNLEFGSFLIYKDLCGEINGDISKCDFKYMFKVYAQQNLLGLLLYWISKSVRGAFISLEFSVPVDECVHPSTYLLKNFPIRGFAYLSLEIIFRCWIWNQLLLIWFLTQASCLVLSALGIRKLFQLNADTIQSNTLCGRL